MCIYSHITMYTCTFRYRGVCITTSSNVSSVNSHFNLVYPRIVNNLLLLFYYNDKEDHLP
jgi:hypothetical protein